jgi:small subunit ribosomal protein S6e
MAEFKLSIGDTKTGKTTQVVVSEHNATPLLGKKIGDKIRGETFDFPGYEFEITGGSDYCGFPMRKDIQGAVRKKIMIESGVGTRNNEKGIRVRKTVCGNTIHEKITLVSMKILKHGKKPLVTEAPAEGEDAKPAEKPAEKPGPKAEEKPAEKPKEEPKAEEKIEEKPKKEAPKEEPKAEEKMEEPQKEEKPKKEEKAPDKKE